VQVRQVRPSSSQTGASALQSGDAAQPTQVPSLAQTVVPGRPAQSSGPLQPTHSPASRSQAGASASQSEDPAQAAQRPSWQSGRAGLVHSSALSHWRGFGSGMHVLLKPSDAGNAPCTSQNGRAGSVQGVNMPLPELSHSSSVVQQ
jgi:hypothetical protein